MYDGRPFLESMAEWATALLPTGPRAQGDAFPNETIRIVIPFAAGGGSDAWSAALRNSKPE